NLPALLSVAEPGSPAAAADRDRWRPTADGPAELTVTYARAVPADAGEWRVAVGVRAGEVSQDVVLRLVTREGRWLVRAVEAAWRTTRGPGRRPGPLVEAGRSEAELGLERTLLEALLHGHEVPRRVRAVHEPVVVGQHQVAHRPDRDELVAELVRRDHRALDDRAGAHDRGRAARDDGRVEQRATRAGVRDRERRTAQVVRRRLVVPRALREVGDPPGDAGEVEVTRVVDHRDDQATLGVDGDADVLLAVVGDLLVLEDTVDLRVRLERLRRGLHEERQVGELDALALEEVVLGAGAQLRDPRHVDLDDRGELRHR